LRPDAVRESGGIWSNDYLILAGQHRVGKLVGSRYIYPLQRIPELHRGYFEEISPNDGYGLHVSYLVPQY
jgi:hypothetical protein